MTKYKQDNFPFVEIQAHFFLKFTLFCWLLITGDQLTLKTSLSVGNEGLLS